MNEMKPLPDATEDARLGSPAVTPFHADMPPLLQSRLMRLPEKPKPPTLTAYEHFVAMLHELRDADIETLLCAETDFANFTKPVIGEDIAGEIAELCNTLIDKRYQDHYAGMQHDPFVPKCGDWR